MLKYVFVVGLAGVALFAPAVVPESALVSDWPQYRGPTRDGIAPAGPKLLNAWPTNGAGPKLLWKSATLWPVKGGVEGDLPHSGCGSIAIAGGRAFIFANFRRNTGKEGKVVLSTKDLNDLGWMEGVPDELARKVEEERIHGRGAKLQPGTELDEYVRLYVAGLDPESAKKFGPWIERRLKKEAAPASFSFARWNGLLQTTFGAELGNRDPSIEWSFLEKLAAVRDREFSTIDEMNKQVGGVISCYPGGPGNAIRVLLTNRVNSYFDAIICLDVATGKEIWRKEFPGSLSPYGGTHNVGASGTPAIADGRCYVAGSAGMYCLSVRDGSVIWQAKTGFNNSSPLVMNGVVYVLVPEATAYDAKTGQVLWCQSPLCHPNSSFTKWTSGEKNYLIVAFEGGTYSSPPGCIFCLDPVSGKQLWATACAGASLPVMTGRDTLVMDSGMIKTFKITPAKAEMLWASKDTGSSRGASPLVFQDHIYKAGACHSGAALSCLELKTGAIKWNPHTFCAESSSPVLADGKIIALIEENEDSQYVVMYRASPEKFEELGRFNPHAGPGASPSIAGGKMFLRLQDCVACYDLAADGK
jgi:outer membrane protein assembly factor BamB